MRIRHNAHSPRRVEIIVPGGDELDVSEDVAAQLRAADRHFQPADEATEPAEVVTDASTERPAVKPRKQRGKVKKD